MGLVFSTYSRLYSPLRLLAFYIVGTNPGARIRVPSSAEAGILLLFVATPQLEVISRPLRDVILANKWRLLAASQSLGGICRWLRSCGYVSTGRGRFMQEGAICARLIRAAATRGIKGVASNYRELVEHKIVAR